MGSSQIERQIEQLLSAARPAPCGRRERRTANMRHGSRRSRRARPKFIMRWQGSDLSRLPEVLEEQISSRRFHSAAVGACNTGNEGAGLHHLSPGSHALLSPLREVVIGYPTEAPLGYWRCVCNFRSRSG